MAAKLRGRLVRDVEIESGVRYETRGEPRWPAERATYRVELNEQGIVVSYGRGPRSVLSWEAVLAYAESTSRANTQREMRHAKSREAAPVLPPPVLLTATLQAAPVADAPRRLPRPAPRRGAP